MKINFTFIKKLLLDYKYLILGILLIIIFFNFPVSVSREGLETSNCDYKYLDPPSISKDGWDYWSIDTKTQYLNDLIKYNDSILGRPAPPPNVIQDMLAADPKYENAYKYFNNVHLGETIYLHNNGYPFRPPYIIKSIKKRFIKVLKEEPTALPLKLQSIEAINALDSESFAKAGIKKQFQDWPSFTNRQMMDFMKAEVLSPAANTPPTEEDTRAIDIFMGYRRQPCEEQAAELSLLLAPAPPPSSALAPSSTIAKSSLVKSSASASVPSSTMSKSSLVTSSALAASSASVPSSTTSSATSSLTGNNYQQLVSLCKTIVPK